MKRLWVVLLAIAAGLVFFCSPTIVGAGTVGNTGYVYVDKPYAEGFNDTVETVGIFDRASHHLKATCRDNYWIAPCIWRSWCKSGWEFDPADFYQVPECPTCDPKLVVVEPYGCASGFNKTFDFVGLIAGQSWHGLATCRDGYGAVDGYNWCSKCTTGWEFNPNDFYPVSVSDYPIPDQDPNPRPSNEEIEEIILREMHKDYPPATIVWVVTILSVEKYECCLWKAELTVRGLNGWGPFLNGRCTIFIKDGQLQEYPPSYLMELAKERGYNPVDGDKVIKVRTFRYIGGPYWPDQDGEMWFFDITEPQIDIRYAVMVSLGHPEEMWGEIYTLKIFFCDKYGGDRYQNFLH